MRRKILIGIIGLLIIITGGFSAKYFLFSSKHIEQTGYYTCSMHPQIREHKPGRCPICGMNLTFVDENTDTVDDHNHEYSHSDHEAMGDFDMEEDVDMKEMNEMDHSEHKSDMSSKDEMNMEHPKHEQEEQLKPMQMVNLTQKQVNNFHSSTFKVRKQKIVKSLRLLGKVVQSEKRQSNIPAKISGRVEKIYINSTGSFISKNDPVVDIYSPDLITAGEEYLVSYKNKQQDLLSQAKKKLKLWGIKDFQIKEWVKFNKIPREITIYSDVSGIVTKKNAVEGKYFKEGESFYDLVNLSTVWVEMDAYEHDSSLIKIGQKVDIEFTAYPGEKWTANIDFISPVLDESSRTLKIRTTLDNSNGKLKPGMVGDAIINTEPGDIVLVIPTSAVIDTGKRQIVWLQKGENSYMAIDIQTGIKGEGFTEVKSGLKEEDLVVVDGNFLLDAQSQLSGGNMVHNH